MGRVGDVDFDGVRQRLQWLVDERFGGVATSLVKAAELSSTSHVGMLLRGDVKERVSAVVMGAIAKAGRVRFDWLMYGQEPRDRDAEEIFPGLPPGQVAALRWMMSTNASEEAIELLSRPRKQPLTDDQWIDLAKALKTETLHPDEGPPPEGLGPPPRGRRK